MPFVKGQIANPKGSGGGYSRHAARFAEALRAGPSTEALEALLDAVRDRESTDRIAAAKEILARAYGRPSEGVLTLADFTDDQLWAEMQRRVGGTVSVHSPDQPGAQAS
jgi:hypothetical protein